MKEYRPSTWIHSVSRSPEHEKRSTSLAPSEYNYPRSTLKPQSFVSSVRSVFSKVPSRANSINTLRSAVSEPSITSSSTFSSMPQPLPVVSSRDQISDDEEMCPICSEPLSFSFRLPGEKPHVVPECGHALHEACFTAVYGPSPAQVKASTIRNTNLGVCGVCRRPMKVGDGDGGKSNKLAALTGMGDRSHQQVYPGRDAHLSIRRGGISTLNRPYDPHEDDPIDQTMSIRSSSAEPQTHYIVAPSIQIRAEFPTISRTADSTQPLTCIVVVELPGKSMHGPMPGQMVSDTYSLPKLPTSPDSGSWNDSPKPLSPEHASTSINHDPSTSPSSSYQEQRKTNFVDPYAQNESPFHAITEDLRNRIIDWKGHPLSGLGSLHMYDLLSVRRESIVRDFFVYLFKEAIICVVEEKRRGFGRLLDNGSVNGGTPGQQKGVLRLKGRIYIRHIKTITDTSMSNELSLTIDMEDERLDSFILIFRERSSLETWKTQIQNLVTMFQRQNGQLPPKINIPSEPALLEEFGGSNKAARVLSGSTGTTASVADSILNSSLRSTVSSRTSHGSSNNNNLKSPEHSLSTLIENEETVRYNTPTPSVPLVTPRTSSGPSNSLSPLQHPPMDLIIVVSVPPPHVTPSTAALKNRVIKTTLDFVLASMSSKDRLSLVTFEVGQAGRVRKTPFLSIGKPNSRARLVKFTNEIGTTKEDEDEFLVKGSQEEKTDVVTAVNHGLDVVLQRKARNPISGMILISDVSETIRRAQMDLVLARIEAAGIPIHAFGYGRSHDPASLWLISNHTSGTYTFVKDWYDIQSCIAGCLGGMMSIGLKDMKLHMKVVDGNRFRIRKMSGSPTFILHSDGKDVDVEVGELRYGERREMLVEVELDNTDVTSRSPPKGGAHSKSLNATDQFNQRMGFDALYSIGEGLDLAEGMMDKMIDEVPVFEVDGSFYDPAASKHVSRLAHPVLLTVTLLPLNDNKSGSSAAPGPDPVIVRRRMELLASDMITRSLVLVSRNNHLQAQKILTETRRILHTVLQNISQSLPLPSNSGGRNRKEILQLSAVRALQAIMTDMQVLSDALEDNPEAFILDQRNFGAQQSMILRDQKSWSGRSAIERLFWTIDNSIELATRSTNWVGRD